MPLQNESLEKREQISTRYELDGGNSWPKKQLNGVKNLTIEE